VIDGVFPRRKNTVVCIGGVIDYRACAKVIIDVSFDEQSKLKER